MILNHACRVDTISASVLLSCHIFIICPVHVDNENIAWLSQLTGLKENTSKQQWPQKCLLLCMWVSFILCSTSALSLRLRSGQKGIKFSFNFKLNSFKDLKLQISMTAVKRGLFDTPSFVWSNCRFHRGLKIM